MHSEKEVEEEKEKELAVRERYEEFQTYVQTLEAMLKWKDKSGRSGSRTFKL